MTPAQSGLSPRERRANLRGAFQVRSGAELSGKCILLVDDILTTGTTAHEASKALRRADAERVVVAVVARGLGQSDRF
jgi:predicted amidophosphoribosyltransferase